MKVIIGRTSQLREFWWLWLLCICFLTATCFAWGIKAQATTTFDDVFNDDDVKLVSLSENKSVGGRGYDINCIPIGEGLSRCNLVLEAKSKASVQLGNAYFSQEFKILKGSPNIRAFGYDVFDGNDWVKLESVNAIAGETFYVDLWAEIEGEDWQVDALPVWLGASGDENPLAKFALWESTSAGGDEVGVGIDTINTAICQPWTASGSYNLKVLSFYGRNYGNLGVGDCYYSVWNYSDVTPDTQLSAAQWFNASDITSTITWYNITLDTAFSVQNGADYCDYFFCDLTDGGIYFRGQNSAPEHFLNRTSTGIWQTNPDNNEVVGIMHYDDEGFTEENNTAPLFEPIADFNLSRNFGPFDIDLKPNVSDAETPDEDLTYSWTMNDTNIVDMLIVNETGNMSFTSIQDKYGSVLIQVTVNDGSATNSTQFIVTVDRNNQPPTQSAPKLEASSPDNTTNDIIYCYNQSSDPDGDPIYNNYAWFLDGEPYQVLYLPFDIDATDYSGYGNNGTVSGAQITTGTLGNAYSFDGYDDTITVPYSSAIDLNAETNEPFSIEFWYQTSSTDTWMGLLSKMGEGENEKGWYILLYDGGLYIYIVDGAIPTYQHYIDTIVPGDTRDNSWHHVVLTREGPEFKLYLDSALVAYEIKPLFGNLSTGVDLSIGSWSGGGDYFDGKIDEIRLYKKALTDQEILQHYQKHYDFIPAEITNLNDEWQCRVTGNDGEYETGTLASNTLTIIPRNVSISFNVTSGEDGSAIQQLDDINCNYGGFAWDSDPSNPYGPYLFPEGTTWGCTFKETIPSTQYWNKTITFMPDGDAGSQSIDVVLSAHGGLLAEEHMQLAWLYDCWHDGDCMKLLEYINETASNIWDNFRRTDESIVLEEEMVNNGYGEGDPILIDYTIHIPRKPGYSDYDLLPVRMYFWFADEELTGAPFCYDQGYKENETVVTPICRPLMAETLGPMNNNLSFQVNLQPGLPAGSYSVIRSIEIDPQGNWINYGQEKIGTIKVTEKNDNPSIEITDVQMPQKPENEETATIPKDDQKHGDNSITGNSVLDSIKALNLFGYYTGLISLFVLAGVLLVLNLRRR